MYDNSQLSQQEIECLEMFQMFDKGAHELILKMNLKKWEYVLYNGVRPELYPQDKIALFTMLRFKNDRMEKEQKKIQKEAEIQQRKNSMGLGQRGR
jgi:hypothetical protein